MDYENAIILRYGEVWLKSDSVRHQFERTLADNVRSIFTAGTHISVVPGRIWVYSDKAPRELERVFGIVSFSQAIICDKTVDAIKAAAKQITSKWKSGTFAIRASRSDKSFPLNSRQLEIEIAELVKLPVDLTNPKHTLSVEVRDHVYLFEKTVQGPGGLPLGSAGKVTSYLRDADDAAAAWMVMKRGALPILVKPKPSMLKMLEKWSIGKKLRVVKTIKEAVKKGAIAFVNVRSKKAVESGLIVLNPLVGFTDDEQAKLIARIKKG